MPRRGTPRVPRAVPNSWSSVAKERFIRGAELQGRRFLHRRRKMLGQVGRELPRIPDRIGIGGDGQGLQETHHPVTSLCVQTSAALRHWQAVEHVQRPQRRSDRPASVARWSRAAVATVRSSSKHHVSATEPSGTKLMDDRLRPILDEDPQASRPGWLAAIAERYGGLPVKARGRRHEPRDRLVPARDKRLLATLKLRRATRRACFWLQRRRLRAWSFTRSDAVYQLARAR